MPHFVRTIAAAFAEFEERVLDSAGLTAIQREEARWCFYAGYHAKHEMDFSLATDLDKGGAAAKRARATMKALAIEMAEFIEQCVARIEKEQEEQPE
jgi:hypothetical protein